MIDGYLILVPVLLACLVLPILNAREWLLNPLLGLFEDVFVVLYTAAALIGLMLLLFLGIYVYESFAPAPTNANEANDESHSILPFIFIIGALALGGWLIAFSLGLTSSEEWPAMASVPIQRQEPAYLKALSALTGFALFIAVGGIACLRGGYQEDKARRKQLKAQRRAEKSRARPA